ncbi:MAG: Na+-dependent transporter [Cyanomargarita calcarea GSE-NOS-MK-12-04C]|jgi:BASS family bile acid:Na+ symporter|uniref:Na+-dependent transporter n=1 Tax=Cyanomargarita calcarea GSE-NOS-MK-12-04C TaxID=2839659 RepID=A0A951QZ37_9CYAN|nr:Na+-dependent transporter [Cyanomargarita calcarea GSE-NOS-MK-12-04C]
MIDDPLSSSIQIVIFLFLFTFLLSVALEKPKQEILTLMKSSLMGRSLFANFILLPILGTILAWLFRLPPEISVGFLMVALAPGGMLGLHFARVAKGDLAYTVELIFLLSLLSIVITPTLIYLIFPSIATADGFIVSLLGRLLFFIIPPFLAGQVIQHWLASIATKLQKLSSFLSIILFITLTVLTSRLKVLDTQALAWNGLAAIVVFIGMAWFVGWQLGGPELANRKVLAISTSMRNVAICLLIATSSVVNQNTESTMLGFSALLTPMNLVFAIAMSRIQPKS